MALKFVIQNVLRDINILSLRAKTANQQCQRLLVHTSEERRTPPWKNSKLDTSIKGINTEFTPHQQAERILRAGFRCNLCRRG